MTGWEQPGVWRCALCAASRYSINPRRSLLVHNLRRHR